MFQLIELQNLQFLLLLTGKLIWNIWAWPQWLTLSKVLLVWTRNCTVWSSHCSRRDIDQWKRSLHWQCEFVYCVIDHQLTRHIASSPPQNLPSSVSSRESDIASDSYPWLVIRFTISRSMGTTWPSSKLMVLATSPRRWIQSRSLQLNDTLSFWMRRSQLITIGLEVSLLVPLYVDYIHWENQFQLSPTQVQSTSPMGSTQPYFDIQVPRKLNQLHPRQRTWYN